MLDLPTSAARPAAVVCGHVTLDRVAGRLVPGGSAWYAAHTFRALGARARVLTAAGADYPERALAGVESIIAPAARTTLFVNMHAPGGARRQRVEASAPPLDPATLPVAWRGADVLHLAPVLGEVAPRAFADVAGARVVGLGVQGLVRAVAADGTVVQPRWSFAPAELAGVTAAFVGEDDLAGQDDLLARLAAAVPIVVFTRGAAGCTVTTRDRTFVVGVFPTREVDPTGAGDVFAAAFLLALARGDDPVEAARLGAAAASIVVEGVGGETLPRIGEAAERARRVPVGT
ncbi:MULTISPECIES: PfkB family carbohydrate kinase [Anaeromyxobacter]|uniref:PfkB family carbohydrate kinase n=1 Tax=Anaeromyxobacter TaxID=161492 RepID=UPI001F579EF6|nr:MULTISPECIES: PfkB family carbohydrate kinase [unclassified Anaeromyxobacter]